MNKNEIIAILSNIEGAVQIDTAEWAIPADVVAVDGQPVQTYVGVKVTTKAYKPTKTRPAFELDEAVAKYTEKCEERAAKEAEKANKPKADPDAAKARNREMQVAIVGALSAEDAEGNAVVMNADEILTATGWGDSVSKQKIAMLMRPLVEDGTVVKTEKDKRTAYRLA